MVKIDKKSFLYFFLVAFNINAKYNRTFTLLKNNK